jgi:hypothetical protein
MAGRLPIHPGHGAGPYVVGLRRAELRALAGEPDEIEQGRVVGEGYEDWCFDDDGVEVRFSDEDGDRASWIVVENCRAELAGLRPIGMPEAEFLRAMQRAGLGPLVLTDDFGHGMRDYEWPRANVSFWVSDGLVESVTVMPFYDASGNVPLWPRDANIDGARP